MPATKPKNPLKRLAEMRAEYGPGLAEEKRRLLAVLAKLRQANAKQVELLHETLCFLRAYPDDAKLLAAVEELLGSFALRPDLRRHRDALADTGIAGTAISYPFFPETALWIARQWPTRLRIEWEHFTKEEVLERYLQFLALWAETPALDEEPLTCRQWLARAKGPDETDATFLMKRLGAMKVDEFKFQAMGEELELPLRLDPAPGAPSRTLARARWPGQRVVFQKEALARGRPDLRAECVKPPHAVTEVSTAEGRRLIALAREAMVTRSRDLDAFMYGDPRDVRRLDFGDGYTLAAIGMRPSRRLLFEAIYGFLTLRNGVPVGYVLNSALFGSAEIAYNVFDSFRGAEAARIYAHVLAAVHHLFGSDSFTIYPYQLGQDNDEALESGAWWFYQKLGFLPRDRGALKVMQAELARMRKKPGHRSSIPTLRRLADHSVFLHCKEPRDDVIGVLALSRASLRVTEFLGRRFGSDRERAERECAAEAASRFGVGSTAKWSAGERLAWNRWSPLLLTIEGTEMWTPTERLAAAEVARAKGGRRESEFARKFDAHAGLRAAVWALART